MSDSSRPSPRRVALHLLPTVEQEGAYANLAMPALLRASRMAVRDRALATELGYGTLRAEGTLDHLLARSLDRPIAALEPVMRAVLRLGAYQLLRTRIPPHAAVGETVGLAPKRASGLANAVLRATARLCAEEDPLQLAAVTDPLARLGLEHAHPRWVVAAFAEALGGDLEETARALAGDDTRPVVHLAALPGRIGPDELATLTGGRRGELSPYCVLLDAGGDPGAATPVATGLARVQDEGSQLCAIGLHRALAAQGLHRALADPAGLVVDLTSGPGGKAALLTALAAADGADRRLLALELRPHRAALVRSALGAAGAPGSWGVAVADGTMPPVAAGSADGVLVDAPCTGLGALRRRPEARWRKQPQDVVELAELQRRLVAAALDLVRPGGIVGYSVCSPVLAEAVLAAPPGTELLDAPELLGLGADARSPEAGGRRLQLWPHRHGTDAMSLTLLRRSAP